MTMVTQMKSPSFRMNLNKRINMKCVLLFTVLISLSAFAQRSPQREMPATCNGTEMISNYGREIYHFTFSSDCREALEQARTHRGRFCDDGYLVRPTGQVAYRFTFSSDCTEALGDLRNSRWNLFCDSEDLININRGLIADLTFESNCREALEQVQSSQGFFCDGGRMMSHQGRVITEYTFSNDCKKALRDMAGRYFLKIK